MKHDIFMVKETGADGVVFGILNPDGSIDIERNRILRDLAQPMGTTFHRAFDLSVDPIQGMEDIIKTGMDRILTSGQAATALEGKATIKELILKAGKSLTSLCTSTTTRPSSSWRAPGCSGYSIQADFA